MYDGYMSNIIEGAPAKPMRVAVITGASRGLGLTLTHEFDVNDWRVIGIGRSKRPANLATEATYRQFDASSAADCEAFWRQLHDEHPETEICLINNAGGYVNGGLTETKPEDYEQLMKSCYFSAVYMTRGLALAFPAAKIFNIISSSALAAHKGNSAYGAAKAAEKHFFQALQQELKSEKYQITNLYPDTISSDGPAPNAMTAEDLSVFIREQAESTASYYLRDVTVWPRTATKNL
jgi:NAD(P)-dependent dehydrogenase (short-subunit alcohol dehydrogenase family)